MNLINPKKVMELRDIFDYVQATGYFRCKECNGAGNWELRNTLFGFGFLTKLLVGVEVELDERYWEAAVAAILGIVHNDETEEYEIMLPVVSNKTLKVYHAYLMQRLSFLLTQHIVAKRVF